MDFNYLYDADFTAMTNDIADAVDTATLALGRVHFLVLFPLNMLCVIMLALVVADALCGAMTPAEIATYGGVSVAGILIFSAFAYVIKYRL